MKLPTPTVQEQFEMDYRYELAHQANRPDMMAMPGQFYQACPIHEALNPTHYEDIGIF